MNNLIKEILEHQSLFPMSEVCGLVVESKDGDKAWPLTNISENKNMFFFDPVELYEVFVGMNPKAVYHTHIIGDTTPSEFDKLTAETCALPMLIVDQNGNYFTYDAS